MNSKEIVSTLIQCHNLLSKQHGVFFYNYLLLENSLPSSNDDNLAMGVLKELDRDYSALRQRLLDLIEKQSDAMRTSSTVTEASETSSPLSVERPIDGERN